MRPTLGSRSFTSAAPALWNSLPADLSVPTTLSVLLRRFYLGQHFNVFSIY